MQPIVTYATLVGRVLQQLRKEKKVEQVAIAEALGISQSAYSRLESGNSTLSVSQLRTAALAIGVQPNDVLRQADEMEAQLVTLEGVTVVNEKSTNQAAAIIGLGILLALLSRS